ncbi:MAG: insulinase family protein [Candidatus Aminicenantes bacterium]|nr:insulinase family protein [Candidatus Aminicenantes bacterium]
MKKSLFRLASALILGLLLVFISCSQKSSDRLHTELLPLEGNPLVSFRILINIGSANDPAKKEGLCQLTWSMLANGGSLDLSFKEISQMFYPMAASMGLNVDKEMSVFTGQIHIDNLEEYYSIFKDMLLNPGFHEEDFIRLKTNQLNFLERSIVSNMDEQFGKEILNLAMYADHPYGHAEAGIVESVKRLTLEDVRAFYSEHFVQGNITIGLAGGYPLDFPTKMKIDFSTLPAGHTPQLDLPGQKMPDGLELVISEKQTPATAMSLGFPISLSKKNSDYFALWIAVSHFGEHRQHVSHLFQKIREERGQNYGDYAYADHFIQGRDKFPALNICRQQQYFSIWIRPLANSNRHFVLRQALLELKKLVQEGIPEERFEMVRTYLLNYTKLYAQTLGERLGWQMDSTYYGYKDFLAEAQKMLPKISREQVNNAIRKYLNYENLFIALITQDAQSFRDALVADTPSPITYAGPKSQEILNEDMIYEVFQLNVKSKNIRVVPASRFFQKTGIPDSE